MQIRFIDYKGMERVRIDRPDSNSKGKLIRNKYLQNKSDRYYFTSEFNQKNEIWFSDIDLNEENRKLQVPFVPTIRIIKPIYDGKVFEGIIIINFFAQGFIDKLFNSDLYDIAIFDSQANMIKHYNEQNNWTEYTNVDYDLENKIGIEVKDINATGEYITDEFRIKKLYMPLADDYSIKYVLNEDYVNKAAANKFDTYFIVLIFVFVFVFIFSYIVSNIFDRLIKDIVISQDKAIKASKAKSEFLANMSHEIRTPLNGILGLIQLTLDTSLNKKQSDFLCKAKSSSNALLSVINDILDYSKIEAGKLTLRNQEFILQNLFDNITDLFGFKVHEKGLELRFQIDNKVPNILVSDSLRIIQVLNNLIGNAIKFTHEGQIIIHIKELRKDKINKKTKLQFCVEDTGIGISENDLKNLFQSFTQAEDTNTRKYGGTGLGLTISKQLSKLLDGDIWVESQKGVGSKFYFTIECSYKDNLNSNEIKKFMSSKKFLIVDDDNTQITYLETILSSWNSEFVSVNDGFKAIEFMQKQKFDYLLLDWNMPIINGIDVLKILKEKNINIPFVIMVTAFKKNELMDKLIKENIDINKVLSKPFTPSVLFEEIMNEVKNDDKFKNSLAVNLHFDAKILLVEDNEINQIVASKYLEKFGVIVEIANDGIEATNMVKDTTYDLIFMDLQMPNMDGFEATKIIRESGNNTPIIALSAAVMQKDKDETMKVGMNKHIAKPIIIDELREILLEYLTINDSNEVALNKDIQANTEINISNNFKVNEEKNEINIYGLDVDKFCLSTGITEDDLMKMLESYYNSNKSTVDILNTSDVTSQEFGKVIHKLKGSSGNFNLDDIYKLCVSIENNLDKDLPIQDILDKLCTELELTIESIRALIIKENDDQ